jgi:hypothetical protein
MAIDFPVSPALDQIYSNGERKWRWNGLGWQLETPDPEQVVILVEESFDWYVAPTGNDETGDGTQANPMATPHEAMRRLSKLILAADVVVKVRCADGTYNFNERLVLEHANGPQIEFLGGTLNGTRPVRSLNGGSVMGNSGTTENANRALLEGYYKTVWRFLGCEGLVSRVGGGVKVDRVLIWGNNTAFDGVIGTAGLINLGGEVAIHRFGGNGIIVGSGGTVNASAVTVTNCGGADGQGRGALVSNGSKLNVSSGALHNNSNPGLSLNASAVVLAENASLSWNGSNGAGVNGTSALRVLGALIEQNGGDGVFAATGSTVDASSAIIRSNQGHGVRCTQGSVVASPGANIRLNTLFGITATGGSFVDASTGTVNSNTGGQYSPAVNTQGNSNSYIQG